MKKLEDFVRDKHDEFDSKLPSPDLWGRIEDEISPRKRKVVKLWQLAGSAAAVLVIAFIASVFVIPTDNSAPENFSEIQDEELKDLIETEAYYAGKVSVRMAEIRKCYDLYPELKSDIESDLNELDMMYNELKGDLNDGMYSEEVIEAMIQNNRLKLEMVDRVLDQINC